LPGPSGGAGQRSAEEQRIMSEVFRRLLSVLFICVAAVGVCAFATPFFTLSSTLLAGSASAAGLAIINSVGNLSGFAAPFGMGWIRDSTGSFTIGLLTIAIGPAFAAIAMLTLPREQLQRRT
jgi:ACS family tartrate transporter-like MFS transporter